MIGFCDLKDKTIFPVDVVGSELTLGLFSGDIVHVLGFFLEKILVFWSWMQSACLYCALPVLA
jgi:hypothetical protein